MISVCVPVVQSVTTCWSYLSTMVQIIWFHCRMTYWIIYMCVYMVDYYVETIALSKLFLRSSPCIQKYNLWHSCITSSGGMHSCWPNDLCIGNIIRFGLRKWTGAQYSSGSFFILQIVCCPSFRDIGAKSFTKMSTAAVFAIFFRNHQSKFCKNLRNAKLLILLSSFHMNMMWMIIFCINTVS